MEQAAESVYEFRIRGLMGGTLLGDPARGGAHG
jgi:hypothetical protein